MQNLNTLIFSSLLLIAGPLFAGNDTNYTYLALGDSIAYGFSPLITNPTPSKFVGYPEVLASALHLAQSKKEVNASCPGETSGSFLIGGPGNGCEQFKAAVGLHVNYPGTQAAFAVSQLQSNKHINLVTLDIGGNDLLLLQQSCATAANFTTCVASALPAVLQAYGANLTQIMIDLRVQGGYTGNLVLVKLYSPSADPTFIQAIEALNQVMVQVGTPFGAKFADGFTAYQVVSAPFNGDPCAAGLLVRLTSTTCDVDPDFIGQSVLAATVLLSLGGF